MRLKYIALLIITLVLATGILFTSSCTEKVESPDQAVTEQIIKDITAREAFSLIQANESKADFVIIDIRTPQELDEGHIENAINIDFLSESIKNEINKLDKTKTYLIYCRSGNRSRGALSVMVELGFRVVYHLSVGTNGWVEGGFPLTK